MASQDKLDKVYLDMAKTLSTLSNATRAKVGSLIVRDTHILAEGVNGTPRNLSNACERIDHLDFIHTKPEVIHSEVNALIKLSRSNNSSVGATIYCTHAPCLHCSKLLIQAGIVRVVYDQEYGTGEGLVLLEKAGITVDRLNAD